VTMNICCVFSFKVVKGVECRSLRVVLAVVEPVVEFEMLQVFVDSAGGVRDLFVDACDNYAVDFAFEEIQNIVPLILATGFSLIDPDRTCRWSEK
jgi:hypothetical protein